MDAKTSFHYGNWRHDITMLLASTSARCMLQLIASHDLFASAAQSIDVYRVRV